MFQISFPHLCYYYTKMKNVQNFNMDQWNSDKQMEYWLHTIQSQVQGYKFPLVFFEM